MSEQTGPSEAVVRWLREPDHAELFTLSNLLDWVNRRPLKEIHQIYKHHAETIRERDAMVKALEDAIPYLETLHSILAPGSARKSAFEILRACRAALAAAPPVEAKSEVVG